MKKNTTYITIILLAVLVAAVLSIRLFAQKETPKTPAETQQTQINPPVNETAPAAETDTPAPALPSDSAAQLPEPAPPAPTEPPVFETRPPIDPAEETPAPVSASGSFRSDTGTYLNISVSWTARSDESGNVKLTADVSAEHYSLYTGALASAVELTVNGQTYTASSGEISYNGSAVASTPLARFTVDVPRGDVALSAVWHYNGSYSGVELETITAAGTAHIS